MEVTSSEDKHFIEDARRIVTGGLVMSLNVDNCSRCGRVFVRGVKDICPSCVKEIEMMYDKCLQYLRENRGATITDVSEATEVSIKQITAFIREGRISLMNAPNLSYPCDVCGVLIRAGNICDNCRQRLVKDVNRLNKDEEWKKQEALRMKQSMTYKTKDS